MAEMLLIGAVLLSSLLIGAVSLPFLIRKLAAAGMTGRDVNKKGEVQVAEMGGLAIIMGAIGSLLLAIALHTFLGYALSLTNMLAAMLTIAIIALIGTFDDMFDMRKDVKTILPMIAALPLVAVSAAGSTAISLPFIGIVDFGWVYIVALIPLGVTVSANLTNMLAGFNGMEAGMGCVMFAATLYLGVVNGSAEIALISAAMLGALLAFLRLNWYPAKVFIGDIGNLAIGTALAVAVILGNLESAGAILVLPYLADFVIKACNRFPSTKWWGELKGGRLHPLEGRVRGAAQLVMKLTGGISEQGLAITFIAAEGVCALVAIALYGRII
ncbi:Phospho-N-acetylmuramoyl-pentapeptide-transferase [uncultured archaeon]|nr:Phospho-N-acetylmuramoyl-pentapeptide-transferase [uncultured archaeon]